ncbi:SCP2 sterol-binding domain-containing protein [Melanogaster broomeanus]|nr:SCP2 sterol-binding domain-containing protein [Melanogaster broomeanus]
MSDLKAEGFKASDVVVQLSYAFDGFTNAERQAQLKKLRISNAQKEEAVWTIDMKDKGVVYKGPVQAPAKAGVTILMSDDTFTQLAAGKLDGQKAFMTGKLKTKGNVMLAARLGAVLEASVALRTTRSKAKL